MKFTKKLAAWFTAVMLVMAMTAVVFAEQGTIDWNKGVVRATGIGAGKESFRNKNPGVYRAQAKRAAMMDAQRNLAETVKGVRVTSDSTMEDMILKSDVVRTRVDTIIKGMAEVSSQYYEDGTYEVVLEMPLFGATESLSEAAFIPFKDEPKISFPQPVDMTIINQTTVVNNNYTGLIIDCSGMNINCVMSPVIKNASGQAIYGHQNLDYDKIIVNGMASYADTTSDQISRSRAGSNPLIVKAVQLSDLNANPVVSTADADKILAANQHDKFLDNCAVVFVK
ncbi:MAG: LPP20 family lipoprotein [Selenomonadaceae bacterium]|nr:LPP20 family lipoprotein [Selenomonadaceae bacterium]